MGLSVVDHFVLSVVWCTARVVMTLKTEGGQVDAFATPLVIAILFNTLPTFYPAVDTELGERDNQQTVERIIS